MACRRQGANLRQDLEAHSRQGLVEPHRQDLEAHSRQDLEVPHRPGLVGGACWLTLEVVDPDLQGLDLVVEEQYKDDRLAALHQDLEDPSALWCRRPSHPRMLVDPDQEPLLVQACNRDLGCHPGRECHRGRECHQGQEWLPDQACHPDL